MLLISIFSQKYNDIPCYQGIDIYMEKLIRIPELIISLDTYEGMLLARVYGFLWKIV